MKLEFQSALSYGNVIASHERWKDRGSDRALGRALLEAAGTHFIQMRELRHGARRIFGCTLWTAFELTGMQARAMAAAGQCMVDYSRITKADPAKKLPYCDQISIPRWKNIEPADMLALHSRHRKWLQSALATPHFAGAGGRAVVVTHHGPHCPTAGPITDFSAAFRSDLDQMIRRHQPVVWLFGHSHWRFRGRVGLTDIRNISIGYPDEKRPVGEEPLEETCMLLPDPLLSGSELR